MRNQQQANRRGAGLRAVMIVLAAVGGLVGGATFAFHKATSADTSLGYPVNQPSASNQTTPIPPGSGKTNTTQRPANGASSAHATSPPPSITKPPGPLPKTAMIEVPAQNQLPDLPNGCEVTSLSMLFTAIGDPVSRYTLADEVAKDPQPLVKNKKEEIVEWGDPNVGFVGSMEKVGFGVYHGPIAALINQILPGRALDLTGQPFDTVLRTVASGTPVEVWTNQNFVPLPDDKFTTWNSPEGPIHTTFYEHAVLLVGYDQDHLYIDNPLGGIHDQEVDRSQFIASWKQMGSQAVTIEQSTQTGGASSQK